MKIIARLVQNDFFILSAFLVRARLPMSAKSAQNPVADRFGSAVCRLLTGSGQRFTVLP